MPKNDVAAQPQCSSAIPAIVSGTIPTATDARNDNHAIFGVPISKNLFAVTEPISMAALHSSQFPRVEHFDTLLPLAKEGSCSHLLLCRLLNELGIRTLSITGEQWIPLTHLVTALRNSHKNGAAMKNPSVQGPRKLP